MRIKRYANPPIIRKRNKCFEVWVDGESIFYGPGMRSEDVINLLSKIGAYYRIMDDLDYDVSDL